MDFSVVEPFKKHLLLADYSLVRGTIRALLGQRSLEQRGVGIEIMAQSCRLFTVERRLQFELRHGIIQRIDRASLLLEPRFQLGGVLLPAHDHLL